jgi:aminomethyltransferase
MDEPDAIAVLDRLSTNALSGLRVGKARYSILTHDDGGAIDDIIVYQLPTKVLVIVNAANTEIVVDHLREQTQIQHRRERALLALQGPLAASILAPLVDTDLTKLANYSCTPAKFGAIDILLARTGYTGEDGFEIACDVLHAPQIFAALMEAGTPYGLAPAGLAARDMLRLEAGMPLYGNELSREITPVQAGLEWAVRFDKGNFRGRTALLNQRETAYDRIVGLKLRERIPARSGYEVFADGKLVGQVKSATIAPSVGGASIATALVEAAVAEIGHTLSVAIRGTLYEADVVPLPFYRRSRS